jgi:hypothetical protein
MPKYRNVEILKNRIVTIILMSDFEDVNLMRNFTGISIFIVENKSLSFNVRAVSIMRLRAADRTTSNSKD